MAEMAYAIQIETENHGLTPEDVQMALDKLNFFGLDGLNLRDIDVDEKEEFGRLIITVSRSDGDSFEFSQEDADRLAAQIAADAGAAVAVILF